MRVQNTWQFICHHLFILTTVIGWVVPWTIPRYDHGHSIPMPYSRTQYQEVDEGRPIEEGFSEEHSRKTLQNACRI